MGEERTIRVKVLLFGPAAEAAGGAESFVTVREGSAVGAVRKALVDRTPALGAVLETSRLAVNAAFASEEEALRDGDEVAVIPPVSGG
ncbi:MAG: hypothetical protein D6788_03450 [Planctomycetota bacterium]|nr:MAG: hypothetical protein D6788_03450 [Planctomycetota bacterium]